MPKPIRTAIPSSSIAKLFELSAAAKAIEPQGAVSQARESVPQSQVQEEASQSQQEMPIHRNQVPSAAPTQTSLQHLDYDQPPRSLSPSSVAMTQHDRSQQQHEMHGQQGVVELPRSVRSIISSTPPSSRAVNVSVASVDTRRNAPVSYPEFIPSMSREFMLTPRADAVVERLVDVLRRATHTRLTTSHAVRALLKAIDHAMEEIERTARTLPALKLPPNVRGGEVERERFEATLADVIVTAMRAAAAFHENSERI